MIAVAHARVLIAVDVLSNQMVEVFDGSLARANAQRARWWGLVDRMMSGLVDRWRAMLQNARLAAIERWLHYVMA